jgi:hypothetical protein
MVGRLLTVVAVVAVAALAICTGSPANRYADAGDAKPVTYQVVIFGKNNPQIVFRGQMATDQFRKWFKSDSAVAGERFEIPEGATPFGALGSV